jgi:hypothetical protein
MLTRVVSKLVPWFACAAIVAMADPSASSSAATQPSSAASTAPAAAAVPAPAPAATPLDIAFDQIDRTLGGAATPPPPTAFNDEVQAAKDAANDQGISLTPQGANLGQQAIDMIPVVGSIFQMSQAHKQQEQMKKQQQEMMDKLAGNKPPVLTRYAFYNGWSRVETVNSIIITKPDQHLTIFIDPKAKTYRTYDMTGATQQTVEASSTAAPQAAGSGSATSMISMNQADQTSIGDQPVTGYSQEAIVTLSGSTGSCHDGTFRAKQLEYFAAQSEPLPQGKEDPIDTLALPDGCSATIARQTTGTPAPQGQMYVYKLITVVRDLNAVTQTPANGMMFDPTSMMQSAQQQQSGGHPPNYMLLSERGNIRTLTAADASLFEIPAGYTQDQ